MKALGDCRRRFYRTHGGRFPRSRTPNDANRGRDFTVKPSRKKQAQQPRRTFVVLSSLVGVLTLTSVLLRAMQGAPLTADAASGLMASDSRAALEVVFNTQVAPHPA